MAFPFIRLLVQKCPSRPDCIMFMDACCAWSCGHTKFATNLSAVLSSRSLQLWFVQRNMLANSVPNHTCNKKNYFLWFWSQFHCFVINLSISYCWCLGGLIHVGTTGRWEVVTGFIFWNGTSFVLQYCKSRWDAYNSFQAVRVVQLK